MDIVLRYSPVVLELRGDAGFAAEDALAEQEVSLSTPCQDVLRKLPAAADTPLALRDLRHAAAHGSLRPHLFGHLSDEQLMELVKFLDFWELPLPWLQMAQAERGARVRPPTQQVGARAPLDAYSKEAGEWALWAEVGPLLQSVSKSVSRVYRLDRGGDIQGQQRVWSLLRVLPPPPTEEGWDWTGYALVHVLCGARQPELVRQDRDIGLSRLLAGVGDLEALQWSREHGCPWDGSTCGAAAAGGHVGVLQWVREQGCPWNSSVCFEAACRGHLHILQWLRAQDPPCPWETQTCAGAAGGGQVGALQWLREHGCPWDEETCAYAACRGQLGALQWLREQGCPWDEVDCMRYAAVNGHLPILRWLRANGVPWDVSTCRYAAMNGHLTVLQWLRAEDPPCPWDESTCSYAVMANSLPILQWLRANGCPWDTLTCIQAAARGQLEVLQWLRANGCPWDVLTCEHAAVGGHLAVLQWLRASGCPWSNNLVREAAQRHEAILQWLGPDDADGDVAPT